jgi:uncharacterized protein (TIGR02246 family)
MNPTDVITGVLAQWKACFDDGRPQDMAALFAEDALFQGFGPHPTAGRAAVQSYYSGVPAGRAADFKVSQSFALGEDVAGGFAEVVFRGPDDYEVPVHMSLLLVRQESAWRIRQYHVSRVVAEQ